MLVAKLMDYGRSFYSLLGDRRKAERVDFACSLTVSYKDRYGQLTTQRASCLNLSTKGVGLVTMERIPEDCDVFLHSETHNLRRFARVRYCLHRGDQMFLGCSFQPAPEYWTNSA